MEKEYMVLVPQCARRKDVLLATDGDVLACWACQLQQQNRKDEKGHALGHGVIASRVKTRIKIKIWRRSFSTFERHEGFLAESAVQ